MDAARDQRPDGAAEPADGPDDSTGADHDEGVTTVVTGKAHAGKGAGKTAAPAEPFAYVALEDLYLGGDGSQAGVMPVCAHRAGALVLPQDVARFGWADQVRRADEPAPDDTGKE